MGRTKKIGSAGRFGVRYGRRVRVGLNKVEKKQKKKYSCPVCKKTPVKRVAAGIWKCEKCGTKFSGGAYVPYQV